MWGIVPAAGQGSRIQPLGFSKELLPVGSRRDGPAERPCAVCEYLVERMVLGGADKICFVIAPGKSDIVEYFGGSYGPATIVYVVQPEPIGLCDALFRAAPLIASDEPALVGLPDTVWFPKDAMAALPNDHLSFLLFPVEHPELFDSVSIAPGNRVTSIAVKSKDAPSHWIWGAFKLPGGVLRDLQTLWMFRKQSDEYVGTLVNAFIANGGHASAVFAGESYVDVGTLDGYRAALSLLTEMENVEPDLGHPARWHRFNKTVAGGTPR